MMEVAIRCERCSRELRPAWVFLPKEERIVGMVSGYCCCGRISTVKEGVEDLVAAYGKKAVLEAAGRLK